jgi:hypothetical protein
MQKRALDFRRGICFTQSGHLRALDNERQDCVPISGRRRCEGKIGHKLSRPADAEMEAGG